MAVNFLALSQPEREIALAYAQSRFSDWVARFQPNRSDETALRSKFIEFLDCVVSVALDYRDRQGL